MARGAGARVNPIPVRGAKQCSRGHGRRPADRSPAPDTDRRDLPDGSTGPQHSEDAPGWGPDTKSAWPRRSLPGALYVGPAAPRHSPVSGPALPSGRATHLARGTPESFSKQNEGIVRLCEVSCSCHVMAIGLTALHWVVVKLLLLFSACCCPTR